MKIFNLFRSNSFNLSMDHEDIAVNVKLKLIEDRECKAYIEITGINASVYDTKFFKYLANNPESWFLKFDFIDEIGIPLHEIILNESNMKMIKGNADYCYLPTTESISEATFYEIKSWKMSFNGAMFK